MRIEIEVRERWIGCFVATANDPKIKQPPDTPTQNPGGPVKEPPDAPTKGPKSPVDEPGPEEPERLA